MAAVNTLVLHNVGPTATPSLLILRGLSPGPAISTIGALVLELGIPGIDTFIPGQKHGRLGPIPGMRQNV